MRKKTFDHNKKIDFALVPPHVFDLRLRLNTQTNYSNIPQTPAEGIGGRLRPEPGVIQLRFDAAKRRQTLAQSRRQAPSYVLPYV